MITPPFPSASRNAPQAQNHGAQSGRLSAFTLIELLCVITIIAIMASMLMPAISTMGLRSDSIHCANNLRTIGAAVQLYLGDNNFNFPCIEPLPDSTVYSGSNNQNLTVYPTMVAAFGKYGVTQQTLQCPSDMKNGANSSYTLYSSGTYGGSSYDWKPTLDDEPSTAPVVYGYNRRMNFGGATTTTSGTTGAIPVKLSKVRQAFDDTQVHFGHMNALYADGHVIYFTTSTTKN